MNQIFSGFDAEALAKILEFDQRNPLLFNSGMFLLLFVIFLAVYGAIRKWRYAKLIFVILFSLYFYYKSSAEYCFILLGVCIFDYLLGLWMGRVRPIRVTDTDVEPAGTADTADEGDNSDLSDVDNAGLEDVEEEYDYDEPRRGHSKVPGRLLILLNVVINIGMLVYFKYFNLLYETFANITNTHFDALNIILPAGISFFTFRSISYIVDIYRGEMEPATNFLEYTFFLTFFPPLLAGPVVRAKDMLPQIKANPVATRAMVSEGIFLIVAGLVKKVIIADYISGNFVDRVFENPHLYSGFENLMGAFGFTLQIYCDFSGYSDMAIGIALLLGFRFKDNFNAPFKSQNPSEFWRRWHISLSTWLRDYIYIPMGGNRKGKFRTYVNQMTTMLIGGLWHGASWMYMMWGAFQGIMLVGHRAVRSIYRAPESVRDRRSTRIFNITITFILGLIGFTLFRFAMTGTNLSESWDGFMKMSRQIFTDFKPGVILQFLSAYWLIVVLIVGGYVLHFLPSGWTRRIVKESEYVHPLLLTIVLALFLFIVIQVRQADLVPFVYLQY